MQGQFGFVGRRCRREAIVWTAIVWAAAGFALQAGCGSSGPKMYAVSGKVTLAGVPVAEGNIVFRAASGSEGSAAAKIVNGQYALQATAGEKRVEITAMKKVETAPSASGEPSFNFQPLVPAKYNSESTLSVKVGPGSTEFDFPLEP